MDSSNTPLESLSDEELVLHICDQTARDSDACREVLVRRFYPKVAGWCLRWTRDREEALDLAQDVFLRVQQKLHTFRAQSRFSTWLYTVTRSVVINRAKSASRQKALSLEDEAMPVPVDPSRGAEEIAVQKQIARQFRQAMARDLEPLEAKILYLHHVDGMTLPAITELLGLENKSGAKAYVVSGKRKLKRKFGRWLRIQSAESTSLLEGPR